eukprot:TRINITY_DN6919_c0_g1_i2.p1 TRINITY_DN6919_c0_g1~~TRINITY_DN6919_c0_g1_i2.p1  ORF type:complete len:615 (+),score=84.55 TRINITY_DN6919_c0_g1_i2:630-2474(+)
MTAGYGYYLDGLIDYLDADGEWLLDKNLLLCLKYPSPTKHEVVLAAAPAGITATSSSKNAIISSVYVRYATSVGIQVSGSGSTVDGCQVSHVNSYGIAAQWYSNNATIQNCVVWNCNGIAITTSWGGSIGAKVRNNNVTDIGLFRGYGISGVGAEGIVAGSAYSQILGNTITRTGYNGILFAGVGTFVYGNVISYAMRTLDDGGGIYFGGINGVVIRDNIVFGVANSDIESCPPNSWHGANGIYVDESSLDDSVLDNTVYECESGIYIHVSSRITVHGNMMYNNTINLRFSNNVAGKTIRDCIISENVVAGFGEESLYVDSDSWKLFGTFSRNIYCLPISEVLAVTPDGGLSLADWKKEVESDARSCGSTFTEYTINGYSGTELLPNGAFSTSVAGWGSWPSQSVISWQQTGCPTGVGSPCGHWELAGVSGLINSGSFLLKKGQMYEFNITVSATVSVPFSATFILNASPYTTVPGFVWSPLLSAGQVFTKSFLFTPTVTQNNTRLNLYCTATTDVSLYLGSLSLRAVDAKLNDPSDQFVFLTNPSAVETSKHLADQTTYADVWGAEQHCDVSLDPYGSTLLVNPVPGPHCDNAAAGLGVSLLLLLLCVWANAI